MGYRSLGAMMVLFIIIALISISLILSPATVTDGELIAAPSALDTYGLRLRAKSWIAYPNYNIGCGIIASLAFAGAAFVCRAMYRLKENADET